MGKSLCHLLIVNHVIDANFYLANMSFNAFHENKILTKISEFTVHAADYPCLGLFQKKIPGRGRRQAIYFSMGGWCGKFSKYMGHWCPTKSNYMGGWYFPCMEGEERILSAQKREKFYQI